MKKVYVFLALALFILQAVLTWRSSPQISFEEWMGSIKTTFWFGERMVFNGTYAHVGWYALLLIAYNLIGFTLKTASLVRIFFYIPFILSLAILLRRYFSYEKASLLLIIVGLSPSLLYFNTLALNHGFDLEVLPVVLLFLAILDFGKKWKATAITIVVFALSMFAMMAYPTFVFLHASYWFILAF